MTLEPESDLAWAAFLYVSGDLPADEEAAFERRLADDQDAREAVAGAVELAGALASVAPGHAPMTLPRRKPPARRRAFALAGSLAAACLAVALIPTLRSPRPAEVDASDVAIAWSDLQGTADPEWLASIAALPAPDLAPASPTRETVVEEDEAATERALPSWLLAAASPGRPPDAPPQPEEN